MILICENKPFRPAYTAEPRWLDPIADYSLVAGMWQRGGQSLPREVWEQVNRD